MTDRDLSQVEQGGCCAPAAERRSKVPPALRAPPVARARAAPADAVPIPGGVALVGTDDPYFPIDGEGPLRKVKVKPFRITPTTVTNAEFAAFIDDTGYVTEAEAFGWSFVFHLQVPEGHGPTEAPPGLEWWRRIDGATWRDVNGPGTAETAWHPDHPVVQVSWADARAYAAWAGGRLPGETEWEHAARGGLGDVRFPWGTLEPDDEETQPCNIWQGSFPRRNTCADGFLATAPARSFEPNGYGLYNVVGNVWEWTAEPFRVRSMRREVKAKLAEMKGYKLLKGGSFLCHKSYCYRYRIPARTGNAPDTATTHQGFRVVWDD